MVSLLPTTTLLLVVVIGVSCQYAPPSQSLNEEEQTPISDRRKFTDISKFKFIPAIKKPTKAVGSWLPSFFTRSQAPAPVTTVHELAPLNQYPIWKVHKYQGIELRPVPVIDAPRTLDVPVVRGEPPSVIPLPQYKPPVADYGLPAAEYGPPNQVFAPRQELTETSSEASFGAEEAKEETTEKAASEEDTQNALDALSNLGSVTSLLGEGDANNLARLSMLLSLFRGGGDKSIVNKIKSLKSWKFPQPAPQAAQAAAAAPVAPSNGIYFPAKQAKKSLFSSFIPNFLRSSVTPTVASSVPLPALPEVEEIPFAGLENVGIRVPELPAINLPTYTVPNQIATGPYVKVKVGAPLPAPLAPAPIPVAAAPIVQEQYYQPPPPPPVIHYNNFPTSYVGNTPLYNSYGVAIPVDSYSLAASDHAPQYVAPAPINAGEQMQQMPYVHEKELNFKNETVLMSQEQQQQLQQQVQHQQQQQQDQPIRNLEYEDNYDMMMEEQAEMNPRSQQGN